MNTESPGKRKSKKKGKASLIDYEIISEIGSGATGTVYKCKLKSDESQEKYAIKRIKIGKKSKDVLKEVFMLKNISHPNIIKLHTSFVDSEYLYMVMEYADGGDLLSLIKKQKDAGKFFSEKCIWNFARQILLGILHLHANDIIHRDLKSQNVMIKDGVLKIGDLGESKFLNKMDYLSGKAVGTPMYLSPEVIKHENYDHRVDVWGFGCIIYHLTALKPPFVSDTIEGLLKCIQFKPPKHLQGCYSVKLKEFIYKMLEKQKSKRPFVTELTSMFPSSFKFERIVDTTNYKKCNTLTNCTNF
ncbi:unnamed protein product [Moneuplotes crassus]|uniref:non-specific serine/threonine protein kinase n=1 Tax=Euplotes crassus TaxID=5936 RepID=A0AAD1UCL3_EUPCR|nr:unnamed protein product [Moneuplotes crassus]